MGLRQRRVELDGAARLSLGGGHRRREVADGEGGGEAVEGREARMGPGEGGVEPDGLLELPDGLGVSRAVPPVEDGGGLEVQGIRLRVLRGDRHEPLLVVPLQDHLQLRGDGPRDVLLQLEDVGEVSVVVLRPEVESVRNLHELGGDAHAVALLPDRALQNVRDAEGLPDGAQVVVLPLEVEGRRPPRPPAAPSPGPARSGSPRRCRPRSTPGPSWGSGRRRPAPRWRARPARPIPRPRARWRGGPVRARRRSRRGRARPRRDRAPGAAPRSGGARRPARRHSARRAPASGRSPAR